MQGKKKLALAMTAMSIAALGGGIGAAGAQAQNEVLQASVTTFHGGTSGWCFKGATSATFDAAGTATGPYPGAFTETNANVSVWVASYKSPRTLTLSIPFTISSGSATTTGTVTNPPPYSGGTMWCIGGSFFTGGPIVIANAATYTATIQSTGQPARTVSGAAQVTAALQFWPQHVVRTPPTVTLLNFPSP